MMQTYPGCGVIMHALHALLQPDQLLRGSQQGPGSPALTSPSPLRVLYVLCVVQLLPADVERIALPRCLSSIGGLLRSRLHSSRDAARDVLGDLALELGPEYMPTIIK